MVFLMNELPKCSIKIALKSQNACILSHVPFPIQQQFSNNHSFEVHFRRMLDYCFFSSSKTKFD